MSVPVGYLDIGGCGIDSFGYEWVLCRYIRGALRFIPMTFDANQETLTITQLDLLKLLVKLE